jgi:hypothetical protein
MAIKKAMTQSQISSLLKFKKDWIFDPVPLFKKHLDKNALKLIDKAKVDFAKQINQIVKNR